MSDELRPVLVHVWRTYDHHYRCHGNPTPRWWRRVSLLTQYRDVVEQMACGFGLFCLSYAIWRVMMRKYR
jgi:hypothetical protein